jgi:hypothetical protein
MDLQIFKLEYSWYEGDCGSILLAKNVSLDEFEKDLIKSRDFAISLLGKKSSEEGYDIECLPEYYSKIIEFLKSKLGYLECRYDKNLTYSVDDYFNSSINIFKSESKVDRIQL